MREKKRKARKSDKNFVAPSSFVVTATLYIYPLMN